ncbi:hypothetical protein DB324_04335 [Limosilactobacillus reuteri]|uniref:SGNH/GDSL hydrolase family protein n=1 Tax=Limosilactobacillus reuteri TaxID=1598 RepID=UPI000C1B6D59|nr:SGNH/GDSL hydrolase family protein [Limosilactobacillus reuteri]PIN30469.1 hypothetical protein CUC10_04385 [Limosilactobacillus reuteri]PUH35017.1 hypothetical protein DB324_04335 [Limosilactobacillus reuteri]PUH35171.1 hypothetical protein DB323_03650 [Limosilactobacillus reuteri]WLC96620.1 SGNH/GDSL hydrolase family protein [Limosilactobacillus reuteri]WRH78791.1 SGNH/GDSL hydrolase family protein [Limosilactobacillus reuteri]
MPVQVSQVTHNNNAHFYRIAIDIAKEGAELWDLTPYFKGRVGDDNFGLQIVWYYQGRLLDVTNMTPYIKGNVGHYSFDEKKNLQMAPDADVVTSHGKPSDCQANGQVTYYFPQQMFPTDGIFKGFIGLEDENQNLTGVDIWFRVLPGVAKMGHACDVYVDVLDKTIADFKEKIRQQSIDFDTALQQELQKEKDLIQQKLDAAGDAIDEDTATLKKLAVTINDINAKMEANDVVTKPELQQELGKVNETQSILSNSISDKLSKMDVAPRGIASLDELTKQYPKGASGIWVCADTKHWYYWNNTAWIDGGVYQSDGIADNSINSEMIQSINFDKIHDDLTEYSKIRLWNAQSEVTVDNSSFDLTAKGDNAGAIVPFVTPFDKKPVYLSYEFKVLDGAGLTHGFDVYSLKPDGNVDHTIRSVPLTTTGYSKVEIPVDYTKQTNEILISIHGTGKVQVSLSINRSGEVRSLEQLSADVGALSKINDDEYTNIFTRSLASFNNSTISTSQNGFEVTIAGANSGVATDWFVTDKAQVLVHIAGMKGFKTIQLVLASMYADGTVHYTTLTSSESGRFDMAARFKTGDYSGATKFRIIANCPDQDAGGTMTVTQLEIIPLDDMQINANYDKNLREMIRKMLIAEGKMNQISAIYDADYTNLWNGEFTKFGSPQIDKIGSEYLITVTKPNDGGISPQYQSSSVKTKVHVEGSFSTQSVDVQVAYQTPNGQKYMKLGHVEGGTLNNDFYFDAVNLAVYQNASAFRTLIQCNDDNAKGVINITSLEEYELSSFQENPIYDRSMQKMMMNIMTKLDQVSGAVDTIKADKGLYLTNAQGNKVQLILNSDGTVGTRVLGLNNVLFMGNSLLLGLDTNNESGGPFGMCASDSKHDYAHYVEEGIKAKNSNATFAKLHDAPFEQAATDEAAQNYITDNNNKFNNQDLVIIQIGDNVNQNNLARFKQYLPKLVQQIKSDSPNATIMLVGVWFDHDGLADYLKQLAQDQGCLYVAISALYNSENRAKVGDTITFNNGSTMTVPAKYASHPGDKGHKAIADAILAQLNL